MDTMSPEKRSRIMAAIRSRGTRPEMLVRKHLFACGFRYRLNHPRLPGKPDIVLRKYRTAVFVNGCFWHGHDCPAFRLPKTNTDFWRQKIDRNRERDAQEQRRLAEMGWHCITVWECQLKPAVREQTLQALAYTLNHLYIADRTPRRYVAVDEPAAMAAEERPRYGCHTPTTRESDDNCQQ